MKIMKAKIGQIQPPHLNNVGNGSNFQSTLGSGIGKVTPVGMKGSIRDKNISTNKIDENRQHPPGENDQRHDEMNQIG